ncbi:thioredoxin [Pseudomonas sp. DWRC2-2]|uniref:thioredoxin n=1 Tax=Pseudomonas sp. DWRC2-2 TaxID=2804567 RepID=UPI003CF706C9
MSVVIDVTAETYTAEVLDSKKTVLVDLWAPWCGPCKALAPALDEAAVKYADTLKVVKVNVDENPDISSKYGVRSIPTLLLIENGEEVERLRSGSRSHLFNFINGHFDTTIRPHTEDVPLEKQSKAEPYLAFNGDSQLKAKVLERVRLGVSGGHICCRTGRFDNETKTGSPFGWILESGELALAEAHLGIPENVAALYDYLYFNFMHFEGNDEKLDDRPQPPALPLIEQWLTAIEVGKDLRALPYKFAAHLTEQLQQGAFTPYVTLPADQAAVVALLNSYYSRLAKGDSPNSEEWKHLKKAIAGIARKYTDTWGQALAFFAEILGQERSEASNIVASSLLTLLIGYRNALTMDAYSEDEQDLQTRAMRAGKAAKNADPNISKSGIEALPEFLAWYTAVPLEKQEAVRREVNQRFFSFILELHNGLLALT